MPHLKRHLGTERGEKAFIPFLVNRVIASTRHTSSQPYVVISPIRALSLRQMLELAGETERFNRTDQATLVNTLYGPALFSNHLSARRLSWEIFFASWWRKLLLWTFHLVAVLPVVPFLKYRWTHSITHYNGRFLCRPKSLLLLQLAQSWFTVDKFA